MTAEAAVSASSAAKRSRSYDEPESERPHQRRRRRRDASIPAYPVAPTPVITLDPPPRRHKANHNYRDFSQVPPPPDVVSVLDQATLLACPESQVANSLTFPQQVHWALAHPVYGQSLEWQPHGRAFRVTNPQWLRMRGAYTHLFQAKSYAVFICLLQSWGFQHITHGPDRNAWYHELFLQGLPHLTCYFPSPKNSRRLVPDPLREPNLAAISQKFPLPALLEENQIQPR
eukprot:CAMPEP_0172446278 /NCGR_PEP_ID=MMETSP1065-20121228/5909_1 /TAXON_ID=265537 /ORGANISM="Amphiprora paludosa, Strain CCMP125" /LENGTH=229 /DNA_ID=CAMNT_0013197351 /DNA_START=59 /DNA_END=748 /DNA_ORIENTATION=-